MPPRAFPEAAEEPGRLLVVRQQVLQDAAPPEQLHVLRAAGAGTDFLEARINYKNIKSQIGNRHDK